MYIYIYIYIVVVSAIVLEYVQNSTGPNTEPWSTPEGVAQDQIQIHHSSYLVVIFELDVRRSSEVPYYSHI